MVLPRAPLVLMPYDKCGPASCSLCHTTSMVLSRALMPYDKCGPPSCSACAPRCSVELRAARIPRPASLMESDSELHWAGLGGRGGRDHCTAPGSPPPSPSPHRPAPIAQHLWHAWQHLWHAWQHLWHAWQYLWHACIYAGQENRMPSRPRTPPAPNLVHIQSGPHTPPAPYLVFQHYQCCQLPSQSLTLPALHRLPQPPSTGPAPMSFTLAHLWLTTGSLLAHLWLILNVPEAWSARKLSMILSPLEKLASV